MSSSRYLPIVLVCALACGSSEAPGEPGNAGDAAESSEAGAPSPDLRAASPRIRQLRVELTGTDVAMRIERARLVDVFETAPPIPSLGGANMLVGTRPAEP